MKVVSLHAPNGTKDSVRETVGSIAGCRRRIVRGALVLLALVAPAPYAAAQVNVTTHHYDNARSGANTKETILTPQNVAVSTFGKLFSQPVNGYVYAQPLYLANLSIPGKGTHNVVFVATEGDSVYAFDADNNTGANASPLWQANLIDTAHGAAAGATTVSSSCGDLVPQVGITSTPVIDQTTGTMYVEVTSTESGVFIHRLHALDVTTGAEKSPGPVVITGTVTGTGDGSASGQLIFGGPSTAGQTIAQRQLNRPGLLLSNGTIYIGYASPCDSSPYHGWVFAFDAATFTQIGIFNTTPNGGLGGIWMSGSGLAGDASGNVYVATGNGTFDSVSVPATAVGDSLLKLGMSGGKLALLDYFTPYNQSSLNSGDLDLGSGGVLLLPDQPGSFPHLLVGAGKQGTIYLLNRDQMTQNNQHYCNGCSSDPQVVQESISGQIAGHGLFGTPAYWNNTVYFWGSWDVLRAIPLVNGLFDYPHLTSSTSSYNFPGATPTISANGTSNGIVWSIDSSAYSAPGPAVLHAHDATNVASELWNSTQAANSRDTAGNAVKFAAPVIANGKVYVGTSTEVDVYGLFTAPPTITAQPANQTVTAGQTATFTAAATGSPAPTVQWQVSTDGGGTFNDISGATSTTLSFTTTLSQNGNQYHAVFTNSAGTATTTAATLTVNSPVPPTISTQPASQTITANQTATFMAAASGSPTPTVQWQVSTDSGVTFSSVSGATSTTLSFTTTLSQSGNQYRAVFTNTAGTATTTAATLTVNSGPPPPPSGTVTLQNANSNLCIDTGGSTSFTALIQSPCSTSNTQQFTLTAAPASGWYYLVSVASNLCWDVAGGSSSAGALILQYTCNAVWPEYYQLKAVSGGYEILSGNMSNGCLDVVGASTASGAHIEQNTCNGSANQIFNTYSASPSPPTVTTQPASQTVTANQMATFMAAASGSPTPTVQWQVSTDGGVTFSNVSGATSTTLSFITVLSQSGNRYRAVFTNSAGMATTTVATLTVNPAAPAITTQPVSQTVTAGQTATFTAAATGSPAPTVQWQVSTNGSATFSDISGATSTTLSFTTTLSQSGNQYRAVFTNTAGTATTTAATLTVNSGPPPPPSGTVTLQNANSNLCIDTGGSTSYTTLIQSPCSTSTTQKFTLTAAPVSGWYHLVSAASNLCWDVTQGSNSAGALIQQYTCNAVWPEYYQLKAVSGGYEILSGNMSNGCLDVVGASTASGAHIEQNTCNGSANQIFNTYSASPSPPTVTTLPASQTVTANQTATFMAAASGSPTPTVQWQVSTDGGVTFSNVSGATSTTLSFTTTLSQSGNQYRAVFTNTAGTATTTAATLTVNSGPPPPPSGTVTLQNANSNLCIDTGGSTSFTALIQSPCSTSNTQQFTLTAAPVSGWYYLVSAASNLCWDVTQGSNSAGALILQYTCNAVWPEYYQLKAVSGGYEILSGNMSNGCLDVVGASTASGAHIEQNTCTGSANQIFNVH